ncbi:peptide/nickel transport system ATP-binding protein [Albimonas donghaensis]|uniref:Peptide/nickel transport system ATP-binding protein n=1 Tax=Albimonas donghaensis TaxID=356660 RepID=A0A1H2TKF7_9RHOB|nr:oligopeptide/dipeptide ABC transporter ATP-binding protein [Albimonas donghaensis]SDW44290.1 peptide/nickel transport system ATP-binding protein [Albimonas donghaensis]
MTVPAPSPPSASAAVPAEAPLLDVRGLEVRFPVRGGVVHAVGGVDFAIPRGQAFGLVGESGSGKTTAALACARLAEAAAGEIRLGGEDVTHISGRELRAMRRRVQIVFQDPYASLNPRERAGAIVRRPLDLMDVGPKSGRQARVEALFALVGLRPEQQALFPHQFSGGQRQRIGIARALASGPELIVCDEPVSALDVAIQAQILNLLARLKRDLGLTYLFISHDLAVVQHLCDEIAVMYLGRIVERAPKRALFARPLHPYTRALIEAAPSADRAVGRAGAPRRRAAAIQGDPPSPLDPPPGCAFAGRCPHAVDRCRTEVPALRDMGGGQAVACLRADGAGGFV